jgi:hypothetical protein
MKSSHGIPSSRVKSRIVDRRGLIRGGIVALGGLALGLLGVQGTDAATRDGKVEIPRLRINLDNFLTPEGYAEARTRIAQAVRLRPGEAVRYWVSCIEDRPEQEAFGGRFWRIANIYCAPDGSKMCMFDEEAFFYPGI